LQWDFYFSSISSGCPFVLQTMRVTLTLWACKTVGYTEKAACKGKSISLIIIYDSSSPFRHEKKKLLGLMHIEWYKYGLK
jgi:hypothetical protein